MTNLPSEPGSGAQDEGLLPGATHLTAHEARFQAYLEGTLSGAESKVVEAHLAVCPECDSLSRRWLDLDAELERTLISPQLTPAFASRLWQRIEEESLAASQEGHKERRQQIAAEFEAHWSELRRRFLWNQWPRLMDILAYGTAAALCGYYLLELGAASLPEVAVPLAAATGVAALLAGGCLAARHQVARWLALL